MNLRRWVVPVCFALALCIALGGQLRAADFSSGDDTDDISSSSDDSVLTLRQALTLEPPKAFLRVALPAPSMEHGRRVIAELFRPPISVVSTVPAI